MEEKWKRREIDQKNHGGTWWGIFPPNMGGRREESLLGTIKIEKIIKKNYIIKEKIIIL